MWSRIAIGILVIILGCTSCAYDKSEQWNKEMRSAKRQSTLINKYLPEEKKRDARAGLAPKEGQPEEPEEKPQINFEQLWWFSPIQTALLEKSRQTHSETLNSLYMKALKHSKQIRVFSDIPLIRRTGIGEATGAYDPILFAETGFNRINEPVGNDLKTGRDGRFKEDEYYFEFGLRKKFLTGAEVTLSQRLRRLSNNSEFFDPDPQGLSDFTLRIVQPLLKGAGVEYNESYIKLAYIDSKTAESEVKRQIESHLLEITRAYWSLYLARFNLLLRQHVIEEISQINEEMQSRGDLDALQSEIYHTEAALSFHRAKIIRARAAVKNAQDRLVSLVNAPDLKGIPNFEIIPQDIPLIQWFPTSYQNSITFALRNRPEIEQGLLQTKAAKLRMQIAENELMPILDGIAEFNMAGLGEGGDVYRGFNEQFYDGDPGFKVGLRFEFPLYNRTARAKHLRRQIEERQLRNQLSSTIESILFEIKVAVREVDTTYQEFLAREKNFLAAQRELQALKQRRVLETIMQQDQKTSTFLRILLESQDVFIESQYELLRSAIDYNLAIINLKKAEGVFLSLYNAEYREVIGKDDLPLRKTRIDSEGEWREKVESFRWSE